MSQTQEDKQRSFREKLQIEGADGFADGPRPWEHWDESGNQDDNRIWEGTAQRVYPKQSAKRGFGDRLLSGLAVIALGSMLVGIAGVYLSTASTQQQARSSIQPPPIVVSRNTTPPATQPARPADTAATAAPPVLARLDTLSPPAAGIPAAPQEHRTVLDPAMAAARTAPATPSNSIDRVAVETVITGEAVTTTVYTQQPLQEEPELVATIATTTPPFTLETGLDNTPPVAASTKTTPLKLDDARAIELAVDAQAEVAAAGPETSEETRNATKKPALIALSSLDTAAPPAAGQTGTPVSESAIDEHTAQAVPVPAPVVIETASEQAQDTVTKPAIDEHTAEPESSAAVVTLNTTGTNTEAEPGITRELETATHTPVLPVTRTGNWVINISSYTRRPTAERKLAEFRQKGVDAEVFTTTINDKPMHRIRVTGFQNARSAKAEITTLEQLLDLEGAWVSRR